MTATVHESLALLRAGIDGLLAADRSELDPAGFCRLVVEIEAERHRLAAVDVQLVADAAGRGLAAELGATSVPDLLVRLTRTSRADARRRVARSTDLAVRRTLTGEPLEPIHPQAAQALTVGSISALHVDVITECLGCLPPALSPELFVVAEGYLVEAAQHEDPAALRRSGQLLLARLDPDGVEPRDDEIERRRGFTLTSRPDGWAPSGRYTTENAAVWTAILDSLSAPNPAEDGAPDPRTAAQRRHDAMLEAGLRLLRSGSLPDCGGVPVSVVVRVDERDLRKAAAGEPGALGQTALGDPVSTERLLRLACEADITTVVLSATGGILDYGQTRRLATPALRKALAARDGGCCFPGCTRPAAWSEAHHVRAWIKGGRTSLDNLCLLCSHHHRTFERAGWSVAMVGGIPQWTPPACIDPERRPRRNTAHHLPELAFEFDLAR